MIQINSFAVIGGDRRQAEMAESLVEDGYTVFAAAMEGAIFFNGVQKASLQQAVENSQAVILPLPVSVDGKTLNAPLSDQRIPLDDSFAHLLSDKKVFCGMAPRLVRTSDLWNGAAVYDYSAQEEFAVRNSVPTAEGAIEIAMREFPGTINGSRCLVAGYGRIGKVLCGMLRGLGAQVTATARKSKDLAWIESSGCRALSTSQLWKTNGYDLIFNTIPQMVFDAHTLARCAGDALVIDLASAPGGVDFEAAKRLGIRAIQALSLPGKCAPRAAGQIIKTTVYHMIEEEKE